MWAGLVHLPRPGDSPVVADSSVDPGRHDDSLLGLVTSRERVTRLRLAQPGHPDLPLGLDPETKLIVRPPQSQSTTIEDREGAIYLSRTVRSLLALCSATLLSAVTLGVSVPIASSASGPTGPAASLPVEVCTGGVHLNLPTSSEVEADGWMRVDYDLGGLKASTEIPPVGFDPRQAPADVLARHDLPSRPATAAEPRSMERRNGQAPIRPNPGHLRSTAIQDGSFLRVLHKLGWGFGAQHNELLLPGGERLSHPGPAKYQLWGLVVYSANGSGWGETP